MEYRTISFTANEQTLKKVSGIDEYASETVSYIKAEFVLGENWSGYDSVRAIWLTDRKCIATVLDSLGSCFVPYEVLKYKGIVTVNLVGSISENDVLTDRLTTFPIVALKVTANAKVDGENTAPITPSQFEQFVEAVKEDADRAEASADDAEQSASASASSASQASGHAQEAEISAERAETAKEDAETARDEILGMRATANTLPAGSDATASYNDGLLTLGIPRGEKGDQGNVGATPNITIGTVETLEPNESATVTITGTDEDPVLNFGIPQGEKGNDGEVTMEMLGQLLPTDTASGEIASFPDGTNLFKAISVLDSIEPIQEGSGTPSPTNIRPISGRTEVVTSRCGVNVWDEEWEVGIIYSNGNEGTGVGIRSKNYMPCKPSATYRGTCLSSLSGLFLCWYDADKTFISRNPVNNSTATAPSNASFFKISTSASDPTTYANDISINYPSTDHDYHAYNGTSYTTDLGRTVYGGTLDVVSGVLTVERAMVDLGTLTWISETSALSGVFRSPASLWNLFPMYLGELICSQYKGAKNPSYRLNDGETSMTNSQSVPILRVRDETKTSMTAEEFQTAMDGVQLVYELATPQTYQLTPQEVDLILGTNNLWCDAGSIQVTYNADIQKWVEKKLSA